ncbi:MAG: DUF6531 domain-containing protein, partial [Peptococcaceae bacterium]|nr:DUF6531 domain-containing protein [Peptococcaceae bacterium]
MTTKENQSPKPNQWRTPVAFILILAVIFSVSAPQGPLFAEDIIPAMPPPVLEGNITDNETSDPPIPEDENIDVLPEEGEPAEDDLIDGIAGIMALEDPLNPDDPDPEDPLDEDLFPPIINSYNPYMSNPFSDEVGDLIGVDTITGAFTTESTDIELYGASELAFTRIYSSLNAEDDVPVNGVLGYGWSHNYDYRVKETDKSTILITPGNQKLAFPKQPDGTYAKPPNADFTLTKTADGYIATYRDKTQYHINNKNRLVSITKLNGDKTTLVYNADDTLKTVSNRSGTLTFAYTGGKLTSVTDSTCRKVTYAYTANGINYTDIDKNVFQYKYDSKNRLIQMYDFKAVFYMEQAYDDKN